ncbi:MAG: class I adenylate-forming enzyme family protein [Aestuariivirga sp.]
MADAYAFLKECKLDTTLYLRYHAQQSPKRLAIVAPQNSINYAFLVQLVDNIALRLYASGVNQSSRVELALDNKPATLVLALALQRLGCACFIPFAASLSGAVACEFYLDDRVVEGRNGKPLIVTADWFALSFSTNDEPPEFEGFSSLHSLAVITTSTGTTGKPKIIGSTLEKLHNSVISGLQQTGQVAGKAPCLVAASYGSLWAFRQMLTILWSGGTLVLGQVHPSSAAALKTNRVRHLATPVGRLADWLTIARRNSRLFDGLEAITTAGAMLTPAMEREVKTFMCRQIYTNYGTTETGLIASGNSFQRSKHANCVGSIVHGVKVQIVDELEQVLPNDQTGRVRIWVGRSHDTIGGTMVKEGWFYPGDLGVMKEDELLCIEGRVDDLVNFGGRKFRLDSLDDQLVGCKGIIDHAVFAVPDRLGVTRLYCAVCPGEGFDPEILKSHLRDAPPFTKIFEVSQLPRSTDGKIKRRELSALVNNKG